MMHHSYWEASAHIGRYKRNLIGSSRTIEIEIPRVQVEGLGRINYNDGRIDMDVVVHFKSEGASNKIQYG